MANERLRAPLSVRTTALVPSFGTVPAADLFNSTPADEPHPDFAERAAIWRDHRAGLISLAEAQRRSANVGRAVEAREHRRAAPPRPRAARPAPAESIQYSGSMSTAPARDDRLTPNAKAFLQVLRARVGRGRTTEFAKATMAAVMSRSARTIRRYLADLQALGYIETEIRRTTRGLHTGLRVRLTDKVFAFFEDPKTLAAWLVTAPTALGKPFTGRVLSGNAGVTLPTRKNQSAKISLMALRAKFFREGARASFAPS